MSNAKPKPKPKPKKIPNADLLEAVRSHKEQILKFYDQTQDERPLLLLDYQRLKLHAYPYEKYRFMLREDSQATLDQEHVKAVAKNKVLVLVWDSDTRRLVTTTFRRP